jgi:predicted esterase
MSTLLLGLLAACSAPLETSGTLDTATRDSTSSEETGDSEDTDPRDSGDTAPDSGTADTEDTEPPPEGSGGSGGGVGTGTARVGSVSYAWHVPDCAASGPPSAVVFTQHGSGGTGSQMVTQWASLADRECFIVIGQDSASGSSWNFGSDVEGLSALVDEVDGLWDVDRSRRYLHGYSAGAHWSYVIGLANSASFGGLGVYAGSLQYAENYAVWPDGTQGPIPVAIGHGTSDGTVPFSQAQYAQAELAGAGWQVDLWSVTGGSHAYDAGHQAVAWAWWEDGREAR